MRILAAIPAALLATGAMAQTSTPAAPAAAPAVPAPKKTAFDVLAERSNITISGRAWASIENVRADEGSVPGASVRQRNRLSNNSSYLRFEGETDLFEGWQAIAQVEAEFGIDGESGAPFSGTRNTGVGLRSPYGTLILGRWDSPTKQTTIGLDPFGGTGMFGYYNVFGQQQTSFGGNGANRWDRRLNNSVNYTSPTFSGLRVLAAWSMGETRTVGSGAAALPVNPWTASAAVHYRNGPIYAGIAYETRNDCGNPDADGGSPPVPSCSNSALGSATQPNGTDQAFRAGASYTLKSTFTKLAAAYEHISLKADAIAALPEKTASRDVYWGSITQGLGSDKNQLILNYGMASDYSGKNTFTGANASTKDTGAQYFVAAYRHWLGKSTDVYAAYLMIKNKDNGTYRIGSNNFGAVARGSTTTGFGAGLRYLF